MKWQRELGISIEYHREIPRAEVVKRYLRRRPDRVRIAQWLCDEGWISTIYDSKTDATYLIVGGDMTDVDVLNAIAGILHENVTRDRMARYGWLPVSAVRVRTAEAYALLQALREELVGLKKMEAEAALRFFPPSGVLRGRHSTDEFMFPVWLTFAKRVIAEWDKKGSFPLTREERAGILDSWLGMRLRKGRWNRTSKQAKAKSTSPPTQTT